MKLYVRPGCHLCDEALALLLQSRVSVTRINIDQNPELQQQYGVLIPVLYDPKTDRELLWPFTYEDIVKFIEKG